MASKTNFYTQSMDEIVFDNRNKNYGAFVLRATYNQHLGKALFLSIGLFVLLLFSPRIAAKLGFSGSDADVVPPEEIFEFQDLRIQLPVIDAVIPFTKPAASTESSDYYKPVERQLATSTATDNSEFKNTGTTPAEPSGTGPSDVIPSGIVIPLEPEKTKPDAILIDQKARFIGGDDAFQAFISENIIYPIAEEENGIEGMTGVSFVVTAEGKVENVRVAQSSGYRALDEEAIRVVKKTSKMYHPGKSAGIAVRSNCIVQITFELNQ